MARQSFDKLDLTILKALSDNARTAYLEIARDYGVSGAAVHQRIQRLMSTKTIMGSHCEIDPEALGYNLVAYIGIRAEANADVYDLAAKIEEIPQVTECYIVAGHFDLIIKVHAADNNQLREIIENRVRSLRVVSTNTMIALQQAFKRPLPILGEA